jgi:organic radical activating enzyme
MRTTYPITERFLAWQGEGVHAGRCAYFIRLHGCPVHCPWCDSANTWHKDWIPPNVPRIDAGELAAQAVVGCPEFVVLTGGEPTVHELEPMVKALASVGLRVHLETCGGFTFRREGIVWVTISPKRDQTPKEENLFSCSEIKIIVDEPGAGFFWMKYLASFFAGVHHIGRPVYLNPEWSQRANPEVLSEITRLVKKYPKVCRAGFQIHKLYNCDAEGGGIKAAPLGGDPTKGF